ncbi:MAG: NAD-dependent epimerase/dehydratase family protein [Myxococcales bacterium]|nr:NAD-dependent epimerase/dehydratase family protein [Myxococcales bacterium]
MSSVSTDPECVLVTGGAGFIGSHLVDALVSRGSSVLVLDDLSTGKESNLEEHLSLAAPEASRVELLVADICGDLEASLAPYAGRIRRVAHLAAQVSVAESVEDPPRDVRINLEGTARILEWSRRHGVQKLVFASSAAVYGDTPEVPTSEFSPLDPLSPYGIDKLAGEQMARFYARTRGLRTSSLRFFNVYGPRQDPSNPYSGVISVFASRAGEGLPLRVHGDGRQTRDFVYVRDVAEAIVCALRSEASELEPINIGTGRAVSILTLAERIIATLGAASEIELGEARPGDILHSRAIVERARACLGFEARTSLEEGLRQLLRAV